MLGAAPLSFHGRQFSVYILFIVNLLWTFSKFLQANSQNITMGVTKQNIVYQQQLNPNDVYSFPIRPIKVRMGKTTNSRKRRWWIREDRSWAHDHCVSKQTVRSDSGWVKTWDLQQQYSLPLSRLDTFPATHLWEGERQGYFPHTCMKRLRMSVFKEWWLLVFELAAITALRQHWGDCHNRNKQHATNFMSIPN